MVRRGSGPDAVHSLDSKVYWVWAVVADVNARLGEAQLAGGRLHVVPQRGAGRLAARASQLLQMTL